jgi:hypothetical protein
VWRAATHAGSCRAVLWRAVLCSAAAAGFLMLAVNWSAIHAECLMPHERTHGCDLLAVAIHKHPLRDHSRGLVGGVVWLGRGFEALLLPGAQETVVAESAVVAGRWRCDLQREGKPCAAASSP